MAVSPASAESMRDYYARRAAEYERVYRKPERQADLRAIEGWLPQRFAGREVLEVASGTGWWTPHGARDAKAWLATDLNPETLAVARDKVLPDYVGFAEVDAYTLRGLHGRRFDAAFAGCWWSHVPRAQLSGWLDLLHAQLRPGAHVVFLDNAFVPCNSTSLSRRDADGNTYQQRTLDDGTVHEVLKNYPTPDEAIAALGSRAQAPQCIRHGYYWVLDYVWQ